MNTLEPTTFSSFIDIPSDLAAAAGIAVKKSLKVQPEEKVLIVSNPSPEVAEIAWAVYDAVVAARGKPVLMFQPEKSQLDFAEDAVIAGFDSQPDVVISLSAQKMGKDLDGMENPYEWDEISYEHIFHYQLYGAKTVRAFWSPNVTREMFMRTVPIDYAELKTRCTKLMSVLDKAVKIRVTSKNGTDILIGTNGRTAHPDSGDYSRPGLGGNLPAGEVFISPVVGDSEGTIVFDGSITTHSGDITIKTPIRCTVKNGFIDEVSGGEEAKQLLESLELAKDNALTMAREGKISREKGEVFAKNARNLGELGIGLNPMATISGNMLEDEKAFRTCHFAIGSNYDDDAPALIHLDGLVLEPTITAIMENGREIQIEKDGELVPIQS